MNDKLPYEDAFERQLTDLPLPGEEQSWQSMKQLLDKDDKRILPAGFTSYGGFVLCAIALVGWLWIMLHKNKMNGESITAKTSMSHNYQSQNNASNATVVNINSTKNETIIKDETNNSSQSTGSKSSAEIKKDKSANEKTNAGTTTNLKRGQALNQVSNNNTVVKTKDEEQVVQQKISVNKKQFSLGNPNSTIVSKKEKMVTKKDKADNEISSKIVSKKNSSSAIGMVKTEIKPAEKNTTDIILQNQNENQKGVVSDHTTTNNDDKKTEQTSSADAISSLKNIVPPESKDTSGNKQIATTATTKKQTKTSRKTKVLEWSAGVGVQQQIPVSGQQTVSYKYDGSKGIIDDYIPSIYLRAGKPDKWFAQAEFSYGAPQPVAEFAYNRKTKVDNTFTNITTTTLRLKKAYYHEIPVSFNYFVLPHLSLGTGFLYGMLHRSIAEQQTNVRNLQTQQEVLSSKIIPSPYTDSFLYKSQWHWLLQASYDWRRFSFGVRYTKDMESYIKYTLPNGEMEDRKNWSLECFVRFRLWQSK